jgi:hypothetical protein
VRVRLPISIVAVALALAVRAGGQDGAPVSLDVRWAPKVGEKTRIVVRSTDERSDEVKRGAETVEGGSTRWSERYDVVREVQAVEAGKVTREHLLFSEFSITQDRESDSTLSGQWVTVDRGPSGSSALPDEARGKLGDLAKGWLERWKATDQTEPHPFLPREKLTPGGHWTIDMARAVEVLGYGTAVVDSSRTHGQGTLKRVYDKRGERWAEIEIKLEIALVAIDRTSPSFDKGGVFVLSETRDLCLEPGRLDSVATSEASFEAHLLRKGRHDEQLDQNVTLRATREERRETVIPGKPLSPEGPGDHR